MPRLWRSNRRVPISASSAFTRLVTLDCTVLSSSAARVMPPSLATVEKVTRSDNSMRSVRFVFGMAAFSRNHLSRMLAGPRMIVEMESGDVDRDTFDCIVGHPPPDPVGADGCHRRRAPDGGCQRCRSFWDPRRRLRRESL